MHIMYAECIRSIYISMGTKRTKSAPRSKFLFSEQNAAQRRSIIESRSRAKLDRMTRALNFNSKREIYAAARLALPQENVRLLRGASLPEIGQNSEHFAAVN